MYWFLVKRLCSAEKWGTGLSVMEVLAAIKLGREECPRLGKGIEVEAKTPDIRDVGGAALIKCDGAPCPLCGLIPRYIDFAKTSDRDETLDLD